jgi:hypothetical protein
VQSKIALLAFIAASLAASLTAPRFAWACHPPSREARVHVSFLADSDLTAMVKWARASTCVDYLFDVSLSDRRLGQPVILTVTGSDVATVFELLLHSMNLHSKSTGERRQVVADGPETDQSKEANLREKADTERDRVFDHIENEIRKRDATHATISRRGADATLANVALMARSLRVEAEMKDKHPIGFRIVSVKPASVLDRLGLLAGDVVLSLNGHDLSTPQKALEAYAKLRSANKFQARLLRSGKPVTLELKIE